jgi:hypothetical protein
MPKNPDRTELVLGVVSPVGSDLAHLESTLSAHIKRFGYPKSLAAELHGDAIAVDQATEGRVCFLPFTGIAARRYFDLFSLQGSSGRRVRRKDADGVHKAIWERKAAIPRVPMTPDSYIEREVVANLTIRDTIKKGKANETRKKQHLRS